MLEWLESVTAALRETDPIVVDAATML